MRISDVAKKAGVNVETVRYYERKGIITQPEKPAHGGFRDYASVVVDRILFIKQAQELGFSLKEVNELLSLKADPETDCASIRGRAQMKLREVNQKINRLRSMQSALQDLIEVCPGQGPAKAQCTILDALEPRRERRQSTIQRG